MFCKTIQSYYEHDSIKAHCDRESSYNKENFDKLVEVMLKLNVTFPFAPNENILQKIEKKLNVSINIYF